MLLSVYYNQWMNGHKKNVVKPVTFDKYKMTQQWLAKLEAKKELNEWNRIDYQDLINQYGETHAHQTVMDFHRQVRSAILDAVDDGLISRDFTRRVALGGKNIMQRVKFLEETDARLLVKQLNTTNSDRLTWDHFILLLLNTGLRFSEGLALTKSDFNFSELTLTINKSYDYKTKCKLGDRFQSTKNRSSNRVIALDLKTAWILRPFIDNLLIDENMPIFPYLYTNGHGVVYNSTINNIIKRHCELAGIPVISAHGLRHTHASVLIAKGVSIQAVAKRLGHANTITTQSTYIHLLKSAEKEANEQITSILVNW